MLDPLMAAQQGLQYGSPTTTAGRPNPFAQGLPPQGTQQLPAPGGRPMTPNPFADQPDTSGAPVNANEQALLTLFSGGYPQAGSSNTLAPMVSDPIMMQQLSAPPSGESALKLDPMLLMPGGPMGQPSLGGPLGPPAQASPPGPALPFGPPPGSAAPYGQHPPGAGMMGGSRPNPLLALLGR